MASRCRRSAARFKTESRYFRLRTGRAASIDSSHVTHASASVRTGSVRSGELHPTCQLEGVGIAWARPPCATETCGNSEERACGTSSPLRPDGILESFTAGRDLSAIVPLSLSSPVRDTRASGPAALSWRRHRSARCRSNLELQTSNLRRISPTVSPDTGSIMSGAISLSGSRTNARSRNLGCGTARSSVSTTVSP